MKFFNLFKAKGKEKKVSLSWKTIFGFTEFQSILVKSNEHPQLIFKHIRQCGISFIAKQDLDLQIERLSQHADLYIIDVIRQRDVSCATQTILKVRHESPQALLLKDTNVVWKGSHWGVKGKDIFSYLT